MADILSQDEIDALLLSQETDGLYSRLKKQKLDDSQIVGFLQKLAGLASSPEGRDGLEAAAVSELDALLKGKRIAKKGRGELREVMAKALAQYIEMHEKKVHRERPQKRIVTSYDFKHPARVNKDQLRTLENLHDNLARLLSSTFSGAMRAVVDVHTAFVDQTTYAEFIMSLSNPSCSYQFTLGPTIGQAIIDFPMPVVFGFVDRTFGGKGSPKGVEPRTLTPIEVGVIHRITKRVIEDLEATWEPILRVEVTDIELETNPEFMQITAPSEIVILLAFEVNSHNARGLVSLCYPFFILESILPRLGQQSYVRSSRTNKNELIQQNNLRLSKTFMPVTAELGRTQISLGEARTLQAGDIICSDTPKTGPVVVFVEEEPKFMARPFAGENGKQALKIGGVIPPGHEEIYKNRSKPVPNG
jgi:flagellar motor switch protein FliM